MKKRILAFLLTIVFLAASCVTALAEATSEGIATAISTNDSELQRAFSYGFFPQKAFAQLDQNISFQALLDAILSYLSLSQDTSIETFNWNCQQNETPNKRTQSHPSVAWAIA